MFLKTINKDAETLAKSGMKINIGGTGSSNKSKNSSPNSGIELTSKVKTFLQDCLQVILVKC